MSNPDPTFFTLRFKRGNITILILAAPLTPFSKIIDELLAILRERYPRGLDKVTSSNLIQVPDSNSDVLLGIPKDVYKLRKGWNELDMEGTNNKACPKSVGLKDGSVLAFKFIDEGDEDSGDMKFWVEEPDEQALYADP